MAVVIDKNICPQDYSCSLITQCLVDAITQNGTGLPEIDQKSCVECGICILSCPNKAVRYQD